MTEPQSLGLKLVTFLVLLVLGFGLLGLMPASVVYGATPKNPSTPGNGSGNCDETNGLCANCANDSGCILNDNPDEGTTCTKSTCDLVTAYVDPAIDLMSGLVGVLAVISLLVSSIQYISSGGDAQKAAAAKSRIAQTIFGLIAFLFLYFFLQFIVPGGFLNSKG